MNDMTMTMKESRSLSADLRDENGSQKVMLHAAYGARTFSLTVETLDSGFVAGHRDEVQGQVAAFIREAMLRASETLDAIPDALGTA